MRIRAGRGRAVIGSISLVLLFSCGIGAFPLQPAMGQDDAQPPANAQDDEERKLTAAEVLEDVQKAYRSCSTYQDTGGLTVRTEYDDARPDETVEDSTFQTAFVRPSRYRYEYHSTFENGQPLRAIVWRDGDESRCISTNQRLPERKSR